MPQIGTQDSCHLTNILPTVSSIHCFFHFIPVPLTFFPSFSPHFQIYQHNLFSFIPFPLPHPNFYADHLLLPIILISNILLIYHPIVWCWVLFCLVLYSLYSVGFYTDSSLRYSVCCDCVRLLHLPFINTYSIPVFSFLPTSASFHVAKLLIILCTLKYLGILW